MKLSRNSVLLVAAIVLSTLFALREVTRAEVGVAPVADPDAGRVLIWISKKGKETSGRFVRMSGDELLIERDGRELRLTVSHLSDESARQARMLAGLPSDPHPEGDLPEAKFQVRRLVSAGHFDMGSPADELGREENEPLHDVKIRSDFMMKATEVTWAEWNSVRKLAANYGYTDLSAGINGVGGDAKGQHPVVGITWWDAVKWCNLMSQRDGKKPVYYMSPALTPAFILKSGMPPAPAPHVDWKADGYRLPTEAEWEFACRPGLRKSAFHTGPIRKLLKDDNLDDAGWYAGSGGATHPVGTKAANRLGLHDMHGNAAEWCWDYFGALKQAEAFDPRGPSQGVFRVVRGGSWNDPVKHCRAAARSSQAPGLPPNRFVGFRWVCAAPGR